MKRLTAPLESDTVSVETLVRRVVSGQVRIPSFQRGLKWKAADVRALYDSIYQGYPVGALLLRRAPAPATTLELGPLRIDAPESTAALWVVDGQQRLVSLAAGLARPTPIPTTPEDVYVVYFDAQTGTFQSPSPREPIPTTWVATAELLDASTLQDWVFNWMHGRDSRLRTAVFEAGARLRDYRIPSYIVETDDESLLRDIFLRINQRGVELRWEEVHDAMFGHQDGGPSTIADLSDALDRLGMGSLPNDSLLGSVVATKGLDVTQNVSVHYDRDPGLLRNGVRDALEPLRRTLEFLRNDAEIPHVRLLPVALPVPILARFFSLYPSPSPRVRELLTRWLWRVLLGATPLDRRTLLRRGVSVATADSAEVAVQELLRLVRDTPPEPYRLEDRFDTRASGSRLALLGMTSLGPLDLAGEPVGIAALVTENEGKIRRVWDRMRSTDGTHVSASSPANRILLTGAGLARADLTDAVDATDGPAILASHGITAAAARALETGDAASFLHERAARIEQAVQDMTARLAGWERSDRPSIGHVLERAGAA